MREKDEDTMYNRERENDREKKTTERSQSFLRKRGNYREVAEGVKN